jgi:non-ribosomal peptide synthase protein (TIGR01720 family)
MGNARPQDSLEGIAIIGMSGRFPGAKNIDEFWQNLKDGVESIVPLSDEELSAAGVDAGTLSLTNYVKAAAILDDIELFDASFFGVNPREAEIMDPQHRLFLECASEALETAGYDPDKYRGWIGVYGGVSMNTYYLKNLSTNYELVATMTNLQLGTTNERDYLATRVSYKLNLRGPSLTVQTACSTSLVAVHLACQGLLNYQCDMALAGGVSVRVPQKSGYTYQQGGLTSPDGHCRTFDAKAQGTVFSNGVGIVVLKRLADAVADGDHIYAVIKGSAINNDGSAKVGFTAPGIDGQAAVVAMAQALAGVDPETISYVEAHGTGTTLGDPIEVAALSRAFRAGTQKKSFCAIGSVKTNIGHADAAAGVAALIKTVLALHHNMIPPSLNFERPNPKIDFENSPFYVNTRLSEWPAHQAPRRAGVSSFGVGGTNIHTILEEAPTIGDSGESRCRQLLLLSAKTASALEMATTNLIEHLKQQPDLKLADVAFTLQVGRGSFNHRRMLVCEDLGQAVKALETRDPQRVVTGSQEPKDRPVAFMFSGQGAQYVNMGLELYQHETTFREQVDRCAELLKPHLGLDLRTVLYPDQEQIEEAARQLDQTAMTQPALFVIEYALAQLWMEWGIRPRAMIGHSIGEYVAACLAGVFSLEDGLALVAARGRLMQQQPGGAMLMIPLQEADVRPLLGDQLSLAAINGPARCVVSGPTEAVEKLEQTLAQRRVMCRRLHTSHAFHSPMMDPIIEPFTALVSQVTLHPPQIPYLSNVTGTWITAAEATDPSYWAGHLRQAVRFADGMTELLKESNRILLEVGPGRTLSSLVKLHPQKTAEQVVLSSVRHPQDRDSDEAFCLNTLGRLWLAGLPVDWWGFYQHEQRHRLPLPTYPFERKRYWVERRESSTMAQGPQLSLRKKSDIADWFYMPSWKLSMPPVPLQPGDLADQKLWWLVFIDECGLGSQLVERLEQEGQPVVAVTTGSRFVSIGERVYAIDPQQRDDYDALLNELRAANQLPQRILHLWNVTSNGDAPSGDEFSDPSQYLSFYSLLFLAQALGKQNITDPIHLAVVSSGMQRVTSEEARCPEKATVLGPCKVIPQEYHNITCRSVDILLPESGAPGRQWIDQLLGELVANPSDPIIAYRGFDRWVHTYEPVRLEPAAHKAPRLREGGVYLITGGLGGIGLVLAEYLAQTVRAKLVLTGRSALPDRREWERWLSTHGQQDDVSRKIRSVLALETLGAEVLVVSADVADREQMQDVVARATERFGGIHGVIHAAGVPGGGLIQLKAPEVAARVLGPKLTGTRTLEAVLGDAPLDFFMLCSSTLAIIGGLGQVDYCAANSFMDAFAHYNTSRRGVFTVSVNWDAWQEVGMAVNTSLARGYGQGGQAPPVKDIAHPLLDQCIRETADQKIYLTEFSIPSHWVLSEHKIMGISAVPGTAYLEMARAAFERHAPNGTVELQEVFFLTPLMVNENETKEVHTILQKNGDGFDFRIMSKSGSGNGAEPKWHEHARGKIGSPGVEPPKQYEIGDLLERCAVSHVTVTKEEMGNREGDFVYWGPRWNSLKTVNIGTNEGLARLELSDAFADDLSQLKLHPSLLDVATAFASRFTGEGNYLPLMYRRLKIKRPLSQTIYSYIRYKESGYASKETLAFDVIILDEQGTELVEIEGFTLKRVGDAALPLKSAAGRPSHPVMEEDSPPPDVESPYTDEHFMAEDSSPARPAAGAFAGILSNEGVDAFTRILSRSRLPQIIVSTKDLRAAIEQATAFTQSRLLEQIDSLQAPQVTHPRPNVQTPYVAPRNEVEQKLAGLWQGVLGIDAVGIHDNFFELGGDSVLAIQVIARTTNAGFQLTPEQLFQHQTVAELAAVVSPSPVIQVEQGLITGPVPLTPMQQWFFEQTLPEPHHWNEAMLLEVHQALDPSLLAQVVPSLLMHHDALRLRFVRAESGWQQVNAGMDNTAPFTPVDLSGRSEAEQPLAIEATAAQLQASLNPADGPLVRVALFHLGADKPSRLLLVIHHLVVDAISWRIWLEDLQTAYQQIGRGEAMALPPKTVSFKQWSERLKAHAQSQAVRQELDYWLAEPRTRVARLPVDSLDGAQANTEASAQTVSVWLSTDETQALLQDVATTYRAQINEVLLTALTQAVSKWAGERSLLLDLEGQSREGLFEDLDVSRTVGPFAFTFPALFESASTLNPSDALKSVKEQFRRIPHQGIGYGLLRYLSQDADISERLRAVPHAEMRFNYRGQIDQVLPESSAFKLARESSGPARSLRGRRPYLLEISGLIAGGQLQLNWTYSETVHRRSSIERLAQSMVEALQSLIAQAQSHEVIGYTPSDFPEAGLSQAELDKFVSRIRSRSK